MKRQDAFRKIRTVCQRLDEVDPATFFVIPQHLYVFGSIMTDKPTPKDIDLLFAYRDRPDNDPAELVYRMTYRLPLPHNQAIKHLRQGMKMVSVGLLDTSVENWLTEHGFPLTTPYRLIWEPGYAWQPVIDEIEANPLIWDAEREAKNKYLNETSRSIEKEQGKKAAIEWFIANRG